MPVGITTSRNSPVAADPAAPSRPAAASANGQLVERLASATMFLDFKASFECTTKMPLDLRPIAGEQPVHRGNASQNPFCSLLLEAPLAGSACMELQQRACAGAADRACTLEYPFGIVETAVGVKVAGKLAAYLLTGQVLLHAPTLKQTRCAVQQMEAWGLDLGAEEVSKRYRQTPVISRRVFQASVRLLELFAEQFGQTANQILLQPQMSELPQITRARQFIAAHYREAISLAAVAAQAGMSRFHFCKAFKRATGLHFTLYLARSRVEKAKNLLLNPNYRIGEIAYEVGFQSLTQFNRIFKHITGCSPTEYRQRLPGA